MLDQTVLLQTGQYGAHRLGFDRFRASKIGRGHPAFLLQPGESLLGHKMSEFQNWMQPKSFSS